MCRRLTPGSAVRYFYVGYTYCILTAPHHSRGAWVLFRSSPAKKRVLDINGYLVSKALCTCARSSRVALALAV